MSESKKMPLRAQYEEKVLQLARRYARMKMHGVLVEGDKAIQHGRVDAENLTKYFGEQLLRAAEDMLMAMSVDEKEGVLCE